jgi:folate-binding Fe-S cluster repair protein YgfZ
MTSSTTIKASSKTNNDMATADLIAIHLPWGVLSVRGPDRLSFLHGLGTNAFTTAGVGSTHYTSFVTAHGKLLSCVRCLVTSDDVKIICESNTLNSLLEYIKSRIFPFDQVQVEDESDMSSVSALLLLNHHMVNPPSSPEPKQYRTGDSLFAPEDSRRNDVKYVEEAVADSGVVAYKLPTVTEVGNLRGQRPPLASLLCLLQSTSCRGDSSKSSSTDNHNRNGDTNTNSHGGDLGVAAAVRASLPSLLCDQRFGRRDTGADTGADAGTVACAVSSVAVWTVDGAAAASSAYDQLRIPTGRLVERDWLDRDVTALEAGLMHTIDFRKGCFVGQEAIAKALASARRNADGSAAMVRRRIAQLRVDATASPSSSAPSAAVAVAVAVGDEVVDGDGEVVGVVLSVADSASLSSALQYMAQYRVQRSDGAATVEVVDTPPAAATAPAGLLGAAEEGTCLALLKASFVVVDDSNPRGQGQGQLRIRTGQRGGSSQPPQPPQHVPVVEVTAAPYPTYDTAFSPAPPVEKVVPAGRSDCLTLHTNPDCVCVCVYWHTHLFLSFLCLSLSCSGSIGRCGGRSEKGRRRSGQEASEACSDGEESCSIAKKKGGRFGLAHNAMFYKYSMHILLDSILFLSIVFASDECCGCVLKACTIQ